MTVQLETLQYLKQSQELVDLYRDRQTDESLTGVVTDYTEDFVYLSLISDSGLPNGIAVVLTDDISRIRWQGNERQSIQQLMDAKQTRPMTPVIRLDTLVDVLVSVNSAFGYVSILTENMDDGVTFIGEIKNIDAGAVLLQEFGTMTSRDRRWLMLRLDEITRVDAGAAYEEDIKFLACNGSGREVGQAGSDA
ncbi:hypothetical protein [Undibacterium sp. TS12]|uniref:hypothetical protein n=1 Tax=Undibacterium sp. TS12 TaxID=2908202 RepID=UPI001F4CBB69|nr:hypothetical protein [Undibacterium sp. TS12]MCH8622491.1 hypothetical protein [Undibacterium sp. TS12]